MAGMSDEVAQQDETPKKKPRWAKAFLAALAETGVVTYAAKAAKIQRWHAYVLRKEDAEFAREWDSALEEAADLLEREAVRRAREGTRRYKFGKDGEPFTDPRTEEPYYELEYSDTLLIFLLKGMRPNKYRDNVRHEHAGDKDAPIQFQHAHKITMEEFRQLPVEEKVRVLRDMAAEASAE